MTAASPTPPTSVDRFDPLLECLVQLAKHHGKNCSKDALTVGLPLEAGKLTPSLFARAAERAQLQSSLVERGIEHIAQDLLPAIVLLDNNRAVLLCGYTDDGQLLIQHPEVATPVPTDLANLSPQLTGILIFARPKFTVEQRATEGTATLSQEHWFWSAIRDNWRLYRDALVAALLINMFALAMPLFTMNVYDRVVPNNAMETLWVLAIGIVVVLIFNFVLTTLRAYVVDTASKRVDVRLSSQIMERVLNLRLEARPASVGSFTSNLRSFESVRDFIASASLTTLVDVPFILLFLLVLAWISPWMVLPVLLSIALIVLLSWAAQVRMEQMTTQTFQASAQRNAILVEAVGNLDIVKTLNAQGRIQRLWEHSTKYIAFMSSRIKLLSSSTVNMVQTMQQIVSVCVVIIGVYLAQDASISLGGIIAASMIAGRCLAPLGQVAGLMMQYHNAKTSLQSIDNYMRIPVERTADKQYVSRPHLQGSIEFVNVSFAYPNSKQAALTKVSFKIRAGEKVAIIGRIGSGKSTLEKLILGLYQPNEGHILLDGMDIRQMDPYDLRHAIGYVAQDPLLFYGSLRDNITFGAPNASDAQLLQTAQIAGVTDFANQHPEGFSMPISERGESLSGGQRQSIAIARALIHEPPILLMDEPTSNLDNQSEAMLRRKLQEAVQDKTLVLVTHRTALLELVDRLIVIDTGVIVADGPKEQVIEAIKQGRIGKVAGRE